MKSLLLTIVCFLLSGAAQAQDYPARALTMVVAFPAGGSDDILARMLAPRLSNFLGQPVNVENVAGTGGMKGSERVAKAAPDGYEFILGSTATHAMSQVLFKRPPYSALGDFSPVTLLAEQPFVVVARKGLQVNTIEELVHYAKLNPKKTQFASEGEGTSSHLVCQLLSTAAGIPASHVAYNGGPPALRDVVDGRIDFFCPVVTLAIAPISRQDVKALAVLTRNRSPVLPEIPSAHEQGVADFSAWTWFALFLPKDVPQPVAARLHEAAISAIGMPFLQARLRQIGAEVVAPERRSPEYLHKFVENEIAKWASAMKSAQLKPYAY